MILYFNLNNHPIITETYTNAYISKVDLLRRTSLILLENISFIRFDVSIYGIPAVVGCFFFLGFSIFSTSSDEEFSVFFFLPFFCGSEYLQAPPFFRQFVHDGNFRSRLGVLFENLVRIIIIKRTALPMISPTK